MYFSYPYFLESTPELGFAAAVQRLQNVATLVNTVKPLGIKKLNYQDCKEVARLYVAAQNELEMVDRRIRNSRDPVNTDGCWVFMACVHGSFVEPYQAAKRYIYIPFDWETNRELKEWAKQWQAYYGAKQKNFEVIEYSVTGRPFKDIPLLSQIYILGHSSAGSDTLSPQQYTQNPRHRVWYSMLAKRIQDSGLLTEFWGKIKVYACSGGADSATGLAFTAKFADAMRAKNYVNCEYFGYTLPLAAPVTFEMFEGKLTSTLDLEDNKKLVQMALGSETIKAKVFSPSFKAELDRYKSISWDAGRLFLQNSLMIWLRTEKEKKPSDPSVRRQF
jgi:hypothetical protein